MHTKGNWSIQGEGSTGQLWKGKGSGQKTIHFGHKDSIEAMLNHGARVDLTEMPHSTVQDHDEAVRCFIAGADAIKAELDIQNNVRVHCVKGRSRTAFTLMVYLTRYGELSWEDARDLVVAGQRERSDEARTFEVVPKTLATSANGRPVRDVRANGGVDTGYDGWIRERMEKVVDTKDTTAFGIHRERVEGVVKIVGDKLGGRRGEAPKRGLETDAVDNLPAKLRRPTKQSDRRTIDQIARGEAMHFLDGHLRPTRTRFGP